MLPTIFIIGKSGAGKDFYCRMVQNTQKVIPVIQYTTRPIRADEVDGKDINCVTKEEFDKLFEENKIFEFRSYDVVFQNKPDIWYYGTPSLDKEVEYDLKIDMEYDKEPTKMGSDKKPYWDKEVRFTCRVLIDSVSLELDEWFMGFEV